MSARLRRRPAGETQVSLRLPSDCLDRSEAVAERLSRDPDLTGVAVNRTYVLRRALLLGLEQLERKVNIQKIRWRNSEPPTAASEFDAVLQDFVRNVRVPLIGLTADGWTLGLAKGFEIHVDVPAAMWVPRSSADAAAAQEAVARVARRMYGGHVFAVKSPRDFAEKLAAWWKAAQAEETVTAR